MKQNEQNALAYELNNRLLDATQKFMDEHNGVHIQALLGAANIYTASWLVNAPNKKEALKILSDNYDIMKSLIAQTPDAMFGNHPSLN